MMDKSKLNTVHNKTSYTDVSMFNLTLSIILCGFYRCSQIMGVFTIWIVIVKLLTTSVNQSLAKTNTESNIPGLFPSL
jgi:hypothetical protein